MFCLSYKNHDFLVNFSEFAKMCSNEDIFVLPLANQDFRDYVRSGRWVGEISQIMYACAKKKGSRRTGSVPISLAEALNGKVI